MIARTASNLAASVGFSLVFLVGAFVYARSVIRALRSGVVTYSGNAPRTSRSNTYRRADTPGLYWIGIVVSIIVTTVLVVLSFSAVGYLVTGKVPLPGFTTA